jgi:hypothetical protein
VALKQRTRALVEECPARRAELLVDPDGVATYLWERWGPDLALVGLGREAFLHILADYQRELWYWLWGNRTWAQCTQGLAGRLARRARTTPT